MFSESRDIFYLYIQKSLNSGLSRNQVFRLINYTLVNLLKDIVKTLRHPFIFNQIRPNLVNKTIVFASTQNNYNTLEFLLNLEDVVLLTAGGFASKQPGAVDVRELIYSYKDFRKYFFLIYLLISKSYRVTGYKLILKYFSVVNRFSELFDQNLPKAVVVSNDHFPLSRGLSIAARKNLIKCIYIQHASVNQFFPPLRFDFAFLYGEQARDIYSTIGDTTTDMICIGIHGLDGCKNIVQDKEVRNKIGIAFNMFDQLDDVLGLARVFEESFKKHEIIIRPHPADTRVINGFSRISRPQKESAVNFLSQIDILVAGNTSLLLEASLMNVYPIHYVFGEISDIRMDYYGFVKHGIADYAESMPDLNSLIFNFYVSPIFNFRDRARYFDSSIGADYEFKVKDKIRGILTELISS